MNPETSNFVREDVLNAFAVEATHDRATLERYLREFPQYALELAQLSHELSRTPQNPSPLTAEDKTAIDDAWKRYASYSPVPAVSVFSVLTVPQQRDLANRLGVPRQIVTAFRERRVIASTIPTRFLRRVAEALNSTAETISAALSLPLEPQRIRSFKSDEKPELPKPASFEELLIQAQVSEERRRDLLAV